MSYECTSDELFFDVDLSSITRHKVMIIDLLNDGDATVYRSTKKTRRVETHQSKSPLPSLKGCRLPGTEYRTVAKKETFVVSYKYVLHSHAYKCLELSVLSSLSSYADTRIHSPHNLPKMICIDDKREFNCKDINTLRIFERVIQLVQIYHWAQLYLTVQNNYVKSICLTTE
jgi:hypothetical protein